MNATRIMQMIVGVAVLSGVLWSAVQAQSEGEQSSAPPKTQEPQDKPKTETRPAAPQDKIHPDVRSKLEKSDDGRVYVLVTLKPLPKEGLTKEQRKAMAKEKQDKLLAKLGEGEFTVDHRFGIEPRMIGYITVSGIDRLGNDATVVSVTSSKIEPPIFPALRVSETGTVAVIVGIDKQPGRRAANAEQKKVINIQIQSRVLERLDSSDFTIRYKFDSTGGFSAEVRAGALETLATHPDVEGVGLNIEYAPSSGSAGSALLKQSVPFLRTGEGLGRTNPSRRIARRLKDLDVDSRHSDVSVAPAQGYLLAGYAPIEPPPGQDAKNPWADQKTGLRPGPTKDPIHQDVRGKLETSEDGRVYVVVTLKPLPKEGLTG